MIKGPITLTKGKLTINTGITGADLNEVVISITLEDEVTGLVLAGAEIPADKFMLALAGNIQPCQVAIFKEDVAEIK